MSAPDKLDELIDRTQRRIDRIERLTGQTAAPKLPLGVRFSNHLAKNGAHITNMVLAGCVFAVAWGQLQQKYQHQGELAAKDELLDKLRAEKLRLEERVSLLEGSISRLGDDVRQELDKGGWLLSPVAQRLRSLLGGEAAEGVAPPAAAPQRPAAQQPPRAPPAMI